MANRPSQRSGSFERVYYLRGKDDFLKESRVRELMDAVLEPATREFNLEVLRGDEVAADLLDTVLATPPMFAERRLVVLRDVSALKKGARAALMAYLAKPAADLVLLLVDPAGETDDEIAAAAVVEPFDGLTDRAIPGWIVEHARTALGVTVGKSSAVLLYEAVGADLAALASELDKLASYTAGGAIDDEAVRAVVGVRSGETMPDLIDAVAERNASKALSLIPVVLAQPKANAVTFIMALATQMGAIAWGRAARDRGVPAAGIDRGLFALLKEGKAFTGRKWGDAVAAWQRAIPRWTSAELTRAMNELLAADIAAKESRVSSEEQLVTSLVLSLCANPERKAA